MATVDEGRERPRRHDSTQFIVTLDRREKQRWKAAADAASLSMAEYVRRAVQQVSDGPTENEIDEARALARDIGASAERMAVMLDRGLERIAKVVDPGALASRREDILRDIERRGEYLDLALLARPAA